MSKLYVVPTPIGNLDDITFRAVKILKESGLILAEDTRTTSILLRHLNIPVKMQAYHKFNEHKATQAIIDRILSGEVISLVSDAGTPSISDPGFLLVRACKEQEIEVECLPGPTAFVPALVNSGLPSDRFIFEGFLPQKKGRNKKLEALKNEERTMIFYESPFRLVKTLEQFSTFFGSDRLVSVSRELTKLHEENYRNTLEETIKHFKSKTVKGEIVIVLAGNQYNKSKHNDEDDTEEDFDNENIG